MDIGPGHWACSRNRRAALYWLGMAQACADLTCEPLLPNVSSCAERAGRPAGWTAPRASSLPPSYSGLMLITRHRVAQVGVWWVYGK